MPCTSSAVIWAPCEHTSIHAHGKTLPRLMLNDAGLYQDCGSWRCDEHPDPAIAIVSALG